MSIRRWALVTTGLLFIALAIVVRFVVVPQALKLPDDLNGHLELTGKFTGINLTALQSGDPAQAMVKDAPFTADRYLYATEVHGDSITVTSIAEPRISGVPQQPTKSRYTVDRGTFESVKKPGEGVVHSSGWIFTLPPDLQRGKSYALWDQASSSAGPAVYKGSKTIGGRTAYEYAMSVDGTITDPGELGLQKTISKQLIAGLAPTLIKTLPPKLVQELLPSFVNLPDQIPVSYHVVGTADLTADQELGVPLDAHFTQKIVATLAIGSKQLTMPLSDYDARLSKASQRQSLDDVKSNSLKLHMLRDYLPLLLVVVGAALILTAVLLALRARRRPEEASAVPATPEADDDPDAAGRHHDPSESTLKR
jgi:hypothetical protein